ncbi:MAG: prepilin-type N-terminal cleavage/methylation domain-containing protein [Acidobacteriota bacterium]|nr:prepilin-type N-terminal cleavage/methylation domain-containing protein [Acidobacteriota bacterium]
MKDLHTKKDEAGFSLIELLIVMVIMLIIMGSVFALLRGTITTATANYEMTGAAQSLRNAQEYISRDILVAGDGFKGIANIWLPTGFVTGYLTARPAAEIDPSNIGFTNVGSVISDFNVPENVKVLGADPPTTVRPRTDRLTLLALDPNFSSIDIPLGGVNLNTGQINIPAGQIGSFNVGEVYYITSDGMGAFGTVTAVDTDANRIFWAEGDALGLNRYGLSGLLGVGTNRGNSAASLRRVQIVHYFVDADGKLIRRVFGVRNASFIDSVIAEHVFELKFRYILNPDGKGTILEQPKEQLEMEDASLVRMIKPSLRVKTAHELQDGERHDVDGTSRIGVRNIQFLEAPVPRDSQGNTELTNPEPTPEITPTPTPEPTPKGAG